MPWKLIVLIFVFIVFLFFIGFNLNNKCDISFGFVKITEVPVFFPIFVSFVLGVLISLPIVFTARKKRMGLPEKDKKIDKGNDGENIQEKKPEDVGKEFNEPPPSYSGGKYFDKFKRDDKK